MSFFNSSSYGRPVPDIPTIFAIPIIIFLCFFCVILPASWELYYHAPKEWKKESVIGQVMSLNPKIGLVVVETKPRGKTVFTPRGVAQDNPVRKEFLIENEILPVVKRGDYISWNLECLKPIMYMPEVLTPEYTRCKICEN